MPTYGCLITVAGRAKIASAIVTGIPVALTEMAVGDGAGNPITPNGNESTLVREVYRRSINAMTVSPASADTVMLEMVIPAAEGPFVIREVGVFDEDGDLIAIASVPASTKPAPSEGATKDVVIIVNAKVDNADAVIVQINPNVVIATRTWVDGNYLRLPGNGSTGQLLRKKSNTPNDFEYFNPDFDATNFIFDCVEEPQVLATDQTIVIFETITTAGMAIYVEKTGGGLERLVRLQDFDIIDETSIELAVSYAAGTRLLGVQNDPNGAVTPHGIGALSREDNLSDLTNKPAARLALGVPYAAQEEAEEAALGDVVMTPIATRQQIDKRQATETEAEAGTDNITLMTPLRSKQQIDSRLATDEEAADPLNNTALVTPKQLHAQKRSAFPVAARMEIFDNVAPDGWVRLWGKTIGNPVSGATERANNDCKPLFLHLWNRFTQVIFPVIGGRGASAIDDWNAGKRLQLIDDRAAFYRSWDGGKGVDIGRQIGSLQESKFSMPLDGNYPTNGSVYDAPGFLASPQNGADGHTVNYKIQGIRDFIGYALFPRNIAILSCIKL